MPERAEPREFGLSDYQRSRCVFFAVFTGTGAAGLLLASFLSPALLYLAVAAMLALVSRFYWIKARLPVARLSTHGLTINDALILPWSAPWTRVYAIEMRDPLHADLRLSGLRERRIALTLFEREDRQAFVEAVRKWIYFSH